MTVSNHSLFSCFWSFCTIQWSSLFSIGNRIRIVFSSDNMVFYSWKIFYPSTSDQDNTMLLESMRFTRYICQYFSTIRQPHFCKLSLRRVRFFWCHNRYFQTNSSLKWSRNSNFLVVIQSVDTKLECGCFWFKCFFLPSFFDKLVDSRHESSFRQLLNTQKYVFYLPTVMKWMTKSRKSLTFLESINYCTKKKRRNG